MALRVLMAVSALTGLLQCSDETVSGYGAADVTWHLAELDGAPFTASATLEFPEEGKIAGDAPCNRFFGVQSAPYPWFKAEELGTTRRACPELDQEALFLTALQAMTLAEVAGDTLLLSNDDGREMLFRAEAP